MTVSHCELIRRHSRPLAPRPTGQPPHLPKQQGLRAVLFDIYGTLFVSASGEVGTDDDGEHRDTLTEALAAVGIPTGGIAVAGDGDRADAPLKETILAHHDRARAEGIDCPEVDIVAVWRDVLLALGLDAGTLAGVDLARLAVEYEVRANPVWPMPHLADCLGRLRANGLILGIVSNAQFFTVELFPALLSQTAAEIGFDEELQFYSYQHGRAKPSGYLYDLARQSLASRGVKADEVLYVGNDMLNDVSAAAQLGFRTALFAGDARSLRLRADDPRTEGVSPDLVLTDLMDLVDCIGV